MDGFPRTLHQAQALTDILSEKHRHLAGVIHLQVPDDQIVRRLSGRWICRQCQAPYHLEFKPPRNPGACDHCCGVLYQRDDDKPETIAARLKAFHRQTEPVIHYYRDAGILTQVDGTGSVEEVTDRVLARARQIQQQLIGDLPLIPDSHRAELTGAA